MNNTEDANNNINIDIDVAEDQQNPLSLNKSVEHNNKNEDSEGLSFENFLFGGVESNYKYIDAIKINSIAIFIF